MSERRRQAHNGAGGGRDQIVSNRVLEVRLCSRRDGRGRAAGALALAKMSERQVCIGCVHKRAVEGAAVRDHFVDLRQVEMLVDEGLECDRLATSAQPQVQGQVSCQCACGKSVVAAV